jgi:hypothetical protein
MIRTLAFLLAALSAIGVGCVAERPSLYDHSRPFPQRSVDGVNVAGPYSAGDVDAIIETVRGQTDEPILDITTPLAIRQRYSRNEIALDAIPTDTADVRTGTACAGRCGSGTVYHLSKRSGQWAVRGSSSWIG